MKIKKTISAILSLALGASFALSLAACGEDRPDGEGGGNNVVKDMVSETVTAEQWAAAFNANNFNSGAVKYVMTQTGNLYLGDDNFKYGTLTITTDVVVSSGKQYQKISYAASGDPELTEAAAMSPVEEEYSNKVDDEIFVRYRKNQNKWRWDVTSSGIFDSKIEYILELAPLYESFEYNNEQKGYTVKDDSPYKTYLDGSVIKFKDHKLAGMYGEGTMEQGSETYETTESYEITYGNQTITLPTAETSPFTGTWTIYQVVYGNATYNIGDTVPQYILGEEEVQLTADTITIVTKNDGTVTFNFVGGNGVGAWEYGGNYISIRTNDLPEGIGDYLYFNYDGTNLSLNVNGADLLFAKA